MANPYYSRTYAFSSGTTARGSEVKSEFDGIVAGLDSVDVDVKRAITMPAGTTVELPTVPADRALTVIGFDSNGDVEVQAGIGSFQGDWATGTDYLVRDIILDAGGELGLNNVYICNVAHTSSASLATDSANWDLMIDVTDVKASEVAAAASASAASTSETNAGASETNSEDSSLEAGDWANQSEDVLTRTFSSGVPTNRPAGNYSALHWAAKASADAAATAADLAATNADVVLTNADVVSTNADVVTTGNNATAAGNAQIAAAASAAAALVSEGLADADATQTAADRVQTGLDRAATAADRVQTGLDIAATAANVVLTNQDAINTAADLVATNQNAIDTAADVVLTNADVVTTGNNATAAGNAQIAAEAAQAAAELAYDNFDDRYLGPKASDPTLDNDGQTLLDGALYFNTTANEIRVYDLGGTTWISIRNYTHPNHTGDVTSAGDGATVIADDAVTYAKMQNISATARVLGRNTAGAGNVEEITEAQFKALFNLEIGTDVQAHSAVLDATTASFLTADKTKLDGIDPADYAQTTNNLSDLANASSALTNLGIANHDDITVDGSGNVGIGTMTPKGKVGSAVNFGNGSSVNFVAKALGTDQGQKAGYSFFSTFEGTGDNGPRRSADIWSGFNGGAWGSEYLSFGVGSSNDISNQTSEKMRIDSSGNVTATGNVTAYSDLRIKDNIEKIDDALSKVNLLSGYTFDRTDVDTPRQTGVIAQEVQEVLPEAVTETSDGTLTVAYGNMMGLMIEAIKELKAEIDELKGVK